MPVGWMLTGIAVVLILTYLSFFLTSKHLKISRYAVVNEKLQRDLCIVQVSDLHNACFGKGQARLLDAIKAAHPDYIFVTGDLFDRHRPDAKEHALAFVRGAVSICPVFVVEGNHESALQKLGKSYLDDVAALGATVLLDASVDVGQVRIIGLREQAEPTVLRALTSPQACNLVLCHRPERFPMLAHGGADVILSGHAHGGQIRMGKRGMYAPEQGVFPKYTEGLHAIGGTQLLVSRGLGNTVPFPRILNSAELCILFVSHCK